MKKLGDVLLRPDAFSEIVMGNSALVRAMIETHTRVVASYPGSPTPEIADAIRSIPSEKRPFYFEFSTNEKVATELAYGASINGRLSVVFFKSVGLNVASDTFVQLSLMNLLGGMIIIIGDDPGANSSQNEQDNRHLAQMSYTPILEPATPSEAYRFFKEAAVLSREKQMPMIIRMTTHVCHAKEKVSFDVWHMKTPDDTPCFHPENGPYIPLTSLVFPMKRKALKRLYEIRTSAEQDIFVKWVDHRNSKRGVITAGMPFLSLMDVLKQCESKPDVLKLAMPYPIARDQVVKFLRSHQQVKVLEELDDIIEKEVKVIAYEEKLNVDIVGKVDAEDWIGEYTPDKVHAVLKKTWPDLSGSERVVEPVEPCVNRPAQMCPGCGHRSAFHAVKKALQATDITVADIGCHSLGYLPPYEMGQALMCMGASTAIGSGLALFNRSRKVVVFMGDSTFFHAALPGVVNAVFNRHPITMILMENGTTAMTGHQDHAASGNNFNGPVDKIPIRGLLEGLGVRHIYEVDTYMQADLTKMVKDAMTVEDFSVVIARHPCMLKFTRRQRRKPDYRQRHVHINQEKCRQIHECVESFACPSFVRDPDGTVRINTDLCIGDGSCVQTCPAGAIEKGF